MIQQFKNIWQRRDLLFFLVLFQLKAENKSKVLGFFCSWCTATAADLAGTTRMQYPTNIRPIKVMCTGTVDPVYVINALLKGADGVFVGG